MSQFSDLQAERDRLRRRNDYLNSEINRLVSQMNAMPKLLIPVFDLQNVVPLRKELEANLFKINNIQMEMNKIEIRDALSTPPDQRTAAQWDWVNKQVTSVSNVKTDVGQVLAVVGDIAEISVMGVVAPINALTNHSYTPEMSTGVTQIAANTVGVNQDALAIINNLAIAPVKLVTGEKGDELLDRDYNSVIAGDFEKTQNAIEPVANYIGTAVVNGLSGGAFSAVVDTTNTLTGNVPASATSAGSASNNTFPIGAGGMPPEMEPFPLIVPFNQSSEQAGFGMMPIVMIVIIGLFVSLFKRK